MLKIANYPNVGLSVTIFHGSMPLFPDQYGGLLIPSGHHNLTVSMGEIVLFDKKLDKAKQFQLGESKREEQLSQATDTHAYLNPLYLATLSYRCSNSLINSHRQSCCSLYQLY